MKFVSLIKSAKDWKVEKISETDWVIKSPDGTYKNSDGKDYHFKTKEDALEELDYLRAENKFDKKSELGFFANPENEEEEFVLDLSEFIVNKADRALEKNNWHGYRDEKEHRRGIEIVKKAIAPVVEKYRTELEDEKIFNMLFEHNEDCNYHIENYALEELLGKGYVSPFDDLSASLNKSASLKKKTENKFDKKANENDTLWLVSSDGSIEIEAPKQLVLNVSTSGDNSTAVKELKNAIKKDLSKYSDDVIKSVLNQYAIDGVSEMKREELEDYLVWTLAWDAVELESFDKSSSLKRKSAKENVDGVSVTVYDHGKSGKAYSVEGLTYDECDKVYTELQNMYDIVDTKNMQQDEMKDKCHGYILCKNTITASKKVTARINDYEYLYNILVNGNITLYKEKLNKMSKKELIDYIDWAEEMGIDKSKLSLRYITSSLKHKAGYSGGWYVSPDEAEEKLQLWVEVVGAEAALDDLASAMGPDELSENLAYIFRMNDFEEGLSNDEE